MKLNKRDNIDLIREACIVNEIKNKQNGEPEKAESFHKLKEYIHHLQLSEPENLTFENLYKEFHYPSCTSDFLMEMDNTNKFKIILDYYQKAIHAAKQYAAQNELGKLTSKLKKRFFQDNRIENLRVRTNTIRYLGVPVTTLLAAGVLHVAILPSDKAVGKEPPKIESIATPHLTSTPERTRNFGQLDVNSNDFYKKVVEDFKTRYANKKKSSSKKALSTDDFIVMPQESQDYIWQIKLGNKTIYMSHGDKNYIQTVQQYLKENNIKAKDIRNCKSVSIYAAKDKERLTDEHGSYIKLDSIVTFTDPKTGDLKTAPLLDGNHIKEIFEDKNPSPNKSTLLDLSESAFALSYYNSNEELYQAYTKVAQKEDAPLIDCSLENQINEQLDKQFHSQKQMEDSER